MIDLLDFDAETTLGEVLKLLGEPLVKLAVDLERYEKVLEHDRPEVIIECGTEYGFSANWFAEHSMADVITIDVRNIAYTHPHPRVRRIIGSSTDAGVIEAVNILRAGRRTMVSLDSDHSAAHVRAEIEAYGPMVSPGCHLVVEDTAIAFFPDRDEVGSPLDAVEALLDGNRLWTRDTALEGPVSMNPAGWWLRN